MTKYLFTLLFPSKIDKSQVTQVNFQVTSDPAPEDPLPQNKMPDEIKVGDTLTFTYQQANPDVQMKSCLLTQFNIDTSEKETDLAAKKELHFKAYDLAKKCIQINDQSYLAQKWYF